MKIEMNVFLNHFPFRYFKEHEVNQEDCSKQGCLDLDI